MKYNDFFYMHVQARLVWSGDPCLSIWRDTLLRIMLLYHCDQYQFNPFKLQMHTYAIMFRSSFEHQECNINVRVSLKFVGVFKNFFLCSSQEMCFNIKNITVFNTWIEATDLSERVFYMYSSNSKQELDDACTCKNGTYCSHGWYWQRKYVVT